MRLTQILSLLTWRGIKGWLGRCKDNSPYTWQRASWSNPVVFAGRTVTETCFCFPSLTVFFFLSTLLPIYFFINDCQILILIPIFLSKNLQVRCFIVILIKRNNQTLSLTSLTNWQGVILKHVTVSMTHARGNK